MPREGVERKDRVPALLPLAPNNRDGDTVEDARKGEDDTLQLPHPVAVNCVLVGVAVFVELPASPLGEDEVLPEAKNTGEEVKRIDGEEVNDEASFKLLLAQPLLVERRDRVVEGDATGVNELCKDWLPATPVAVTLKEVVGEEVSEAPGAVAEGNNALNVPLKGENVV